MHPSRRPSRTSRMDRAVCNARRDPPARRLGGGGVAAARHLGDALRRVGGAARVLPLGGEGEPEVPGAAELAALEYRPHLFLGGPRGGGVPPGSRCFPRGVPMVAERHSPAPPAPQPCPGSGWINPSATRSGYGRRE